MLLITVRYNCIGLFVCVHVHVCVCVKIYLNHIHKLFLSQSSVLHQNDIKYRMHCCVIKIKAVTILLCKLFALKKELYAIT